MYTQHNKSYILLYNIICTYVYTTQQVLYIIIVQGVWLASLAHSLLVHRFHLCIYCMEGYCVHGTSVPVCSMNNKQWFKGQVYSKLQASLCCTQSRSSISLSVNKNFSRYGSHLLIWIFINANFDLRCSWQPAFARIDHTHPMERSIPKFTPKCKRVMLHAHSSLYLPPHNYTPCIKTPFFVKKKK